MKSRLILVSSCLFVSVILCVLSSRFVNASMNGLLNDTSSVLAYAKAGQTEKAVDALTNMLSSLKKQTPILETFLPHESIHEIYAHLADASTSLEIGDTEDFEKALSLLTESAKHLISHEKASVSNIL
ncbi:MAG: DUF4363 family protein [Clostridia bacterium]|nr:DUF4363 family protein [Clostridia bacterium]MBQ4157673.1 DUF4363 family protein [Clostridia bacterium]